MHLVEAESKEKELEGKISFSTPSASFFQMIFNICFQLLSELAIPFRV